MNLRNKKELIARTFGIGKKRIVFIESRKDEIKEAITKQDIRDLVASGAIILKKIKGRKKIERKGRRSAGNIRKMAKKRKEEYVIITRKLRGYAERTASQISKEDFEKIRKKIRNREFKNKADLKKYMRGLNKK
ncbi:MAG: large subunit ribosomal protein L19e [archaeon GW2011_AR19]|nr:MAG: large subunit ribosomal protein L19e [archaeon GW2011_AR19]